MVRCNLTYGLVPFNTIYYSLIWFYVPFNTLSYKNVKSHRDLRRFFKTTEFNQDYQSLSTRNSNERDRMVKIIQDHLRLLGRLKQF
jgi:hypothetical protein